MSTMSLLSVQQIIGDSAAFTPNAGDKVFEQLHEVLQVPEEAVLDFNGVSLLTTAFLNAALGQLYAHYSPDFLNRYVKFENVEQDDMARILLVLRRAKEYFDNKQQFGQNRQEMFDA